MNKKHLEFHKGGLAYLLMMGLTYTLGSVLLVALTYLIAYIADIPYVYEEIILRDDFTFLSLVISQAVIIISILPFVGKIKEAPKTLGYKKPQRKLDYLMAVVLGLGMFLGLSVLSYIFLEFLGIFGYTPTPSPFPSMQGKPLTFIAGIFFICLLPALCEETFFRGFLMDSQRSVSDIFALILSSFMFMAVHASPLQTLYQFAGGVIFAIVALKSDSIIPGILMHFLNNFYAIFFDFIGKGDLVFPLYVNIIGLVLIAVGLYYFLSKKEPKLTFRMEKEEEQRLAEDDRMNAILLGEKRAMKRTNAFVGVLAYVASVILCAVLWIAQFTAGLV